MDCDGSVAEIFLMESKDLLSKIENVLLKMEKGEKNPDFINSIFRSAHTLKGAAAMFDFKELSTFAHEIENLLSVCRNTNIVINAKQINVLIEAVDCLNNLLEESVKKDIKEATILHKQQIIQNLKAAESNIIPVVQNLKVAESNIIPVVIPAVENKTQDNKNQDNKTSENKIQTDKIQEHIDLNDEEEKKKTIKSTKVVLNPANNKKISTEENVNEVVKNFIKVEANKLDEIINLIGEIVIMQAHLNNLIKENKITHAFIDSTERLSNLIDDLRTLSLQLRMLPINETFSKFNRVVRDIAVQKNKQIKLQIEGGDTELDKSIIEKINEPLLHLVRNACDHGIDPPEDRIALGKPECGVITLQALQENGEVIIKASDDGRGMNLEKIKKHAIHMGLLDLNANPTEQEILACIFNPGFSTAEEVTNLSGRGVGMDVVKKEVEKLHGSIQVYTSPKVGTTIVLRLPLTLAIIDGLLIKIQDFSCVIPMWNVIECVQITKEEHQSIIKNHHMQFRNKILPGVILGGLLEISSNSELHTAVIVQQADYKVAIVVDELIGEIQTVIKPMPEMFTKLKWINGATILGNGQIAVILDITGLIFEIMTKQKQYSKVTV